MSSAGALPGLRGYRFANDGGAQLSSRRAFQRAVKGSDRGANGVTQNDISRGHWHVLRSMWLNVDASQIPPDAHDRGVFRLRGHGETHGMGQPEHGHVGGKNNAHRLAYPRGFRVVEQSRE